jgi:hypothetical protein
MEGGVMARGNSRRTFLQSAAAAGTLAGLGDLGFLARLAPVRADEAKLPPDRVQFEPDIEPVVRLLEDTPRERLLEEVARHIQAGLSYQDLLAALLLAGVRNVQPRPHVGFKFHAVLVVNSAHLASMASPDEQRWLPIFWALDYFKDSQARDEREGNWTMARVDEEKVPSAPQARSALVEAMDNWDEAATDVAAAGLARSAGTNEIFELMFRYGARDFRDIGHKAIYVANSLRTLNCIGHQHTEPVLRSLTYALLQHDGTNPARADESADRPYRRNLERLKEIKADWLTGRPDDGATAEMLAALRQANDSEASDKVIELVNRGAAPQSVWDALLMGAGELLMRDPGIVPLHAVTTTNALRYAWDTTASDETRKLLLLQNAAFLTMFREAMGNIPDKKLDELAPESVADAPKAVDEIFADLSRDPMTAAAKTLSYVEAHPDPHEFINAARVLIFLKGTNAHDYKFSSAVLEDYKNVSPQFRGRFLASSVFNLRGSGGKDNKLVERTRAALA